LRDLHPTPNPNPNFNPNSNLNSNFNPNPNSEGVSVGYQIRLESKQSARTRLNFMTTGILLRRLQGDPMLEGVRLFFCPPPPPPLLCLPPCLKFSFLLFCLFFALARSSPYHCPQPLPLTLPPCCRLTR
jgi:hypothetical protein